MHVRPEELRAVRRGDVAVRYAPFGEVTFALATLPDRGSRGTPLEEPCVRPHWGLVLEGGVTLERGKLRRRVPPGSAFYVEPGGPPHRIIARRRAVIAGFLPADPATATPHPAQADASDLPGPAGDPAQHAGVMVNTITTVRRGRIDEGEIRADARAMGLWQFVLASFGGTTGFTGGWCDLPHWGLLLEGGLTIEWEDDVEALVGGEAYYCPGGPPGHRFEVADRAAILDFTPLEAIGAGGRVEAWRPARLDRRPQRPTPGL